MVWKKLGEINSISIMCTFSGWGIHSRVRIHIHIENMSKKVADVGGVRCLKDVSNAANANKELMEKAMQTFLFVAHRTRAHCVANGGPGGESGSVELLIAASGELLVLDAVECCLESGGGARVGRVSVLRRWHLAENAEEGRSTTAPQSWNTAASSSASAYGSDAAAGAATDRIESLALKGGRERSLWLVSRR